MSHAIASTSNNSGFIYPPPPLLPPSPAPPPAWLPREKGITHSCSKGKGGLIHLVQCTWAEATDGIDQTYRSPPYATRSFQAKHERWKQPQAPNTETLTILYLTELANGRRVTFSHATNVDRKMSAVISWYERLQGADLHRIPAGLSFPSYEEEGKCELVILRDTS